MKKIVITTLCVILCSFVFAQKVKFNLFENITGSVCFKGPPISNDNINSVHIIDWSLGYKLRNKISIGVNMDDYYLFNYSNHSYVNYTLFGVDIKYVLFDLAKNKHKPISFEPYFIFFPDIHSRDFTSYDAGVNFVVPKVYYCFIGTGVMLNVYDDGRKSFWGWYFSFGLRR